MATHARAATNVPRVWHVVDARHQVVGRLSTQISKILMGKHKPTFTPCVDGGDFVVVINAAEVAFTGNKEKAKLYKWHTGWMGGLKQLTAEQIRERDPGRLITHAVKGMLPPNNLRPHRLRRLRIFAGADHVHQRQVSESQDYAPQHLVLNRPVDVTAGRLLGAEGSSSSSSSGSSSSSSSSSKSAAQQARVTDATSFIQQMTPEEIKSLDSEFKPLKHDPSMAIEFSKWAETRAEKLAKFQTVLDKHLVARAAELDAQEEAILNKTKGGSNGNSNNSNSAVPLLREGKGKNLGR